MSMRYGWIGLVLLAFAGVSCSWSFEREWEDRRSQEVTPNSFSGCWKGTWTSHWNGHTGDLRAIISREADSTDGSDRYTIRFHATYDLLFLPLTYRYMLPLSVEKKEDTFHFQGSADLGFLAGGVYEYDGTCRGDEYRSTYKASVDHGVFELQRVYPEP